MVEPVVEKVVAMQVNRIQILNMPEGFEYEIMEEEDTYDITLVGLARDLDELDINTLQATIDIAAFMEERDMEEMSAGHYTINLDLNLEEDKITEKNVTSIRLNISER